MRLTGLVALVMASFVSSSASFVSAKTYAVNVHLNDGTEVRSLREDGDVQEERAAPIGPDILDNMKGKVHLSPTGTPLSEAESQGANALKNSINDNHPPTPPKDLLHGNPGAPPEGQPHVNPEAPPEGQPHVNSETPQGSQPHTYPESQPKATLEGQPHVNPAAQPQTQWHQPHLTPEQSEKSMMNFLYELDDKEIKILENSGLDLDKIRAGDETELLRAVKVAFKAPKRQRPFYQKFFKWAFIATTSILSIYALWMIFVLNPWLNTHSTAKTGTVTAGGA